jgi:heterodisulfide reductase subunit C
LSKNLKEIHYNNAFLKEILSDLRVSKDFGLKKCIQCGNCSSVCPAARYTSYRPRKLVHDLLIGQKDSILQSEEIWYCFSCFSCNLRCPRGNNPGLLIHILRNLANALGFGWKYLIPFKNYLISLKNFGLGLTPFSVPPELFDQELGEEWKNMRQNLPKILQQLGMNPIAPRELPSEARDQVKELLELAGIDEALEMLDNAEKGLNQGP